MRKILLINLLLILSSNMALAQQMYQWKDAEGHIHYTDDPAIVVHQKVTVRDRPTAQKVNSTTALSNEQIEARRLADKQEAQQKAQMAANLARLQKICANKYQYIKAIKSYGRITVTDANSKDGFRYLSNEEVEAYIAKNEAEYNNQCSGL